MVCFTSDHNATFSHLTPERVGTVIEAWTDRTAALSAQDGIEQVFCFENRGAEIGVTLAHPHGQIYGYPFVTPHTAAMLRQVGRLPRPRPAATCSVTWSTPRSPTAPRIVAQNEHWVAFVPFAGRWPVEVQIFPRQRCADLTELTVSQRLALPPIYLEVLRRMEGVFDDTLPAITAWHQAPVRQGRDDFWLHLQIFTIRRAVGKLKFLAGSESAMGAFVNDISSGGRSAAAPRRGGGRRPAFRHAGDQQTSAN